MLRQCAAVSSILFALSVASRLVAENADGTVPAAGRALILRALHWNDVAEGEMDDDALRLQHYASAFAFLQAARELTSDMELERSTGLDVSKISADIEHRCAKTRQNIRDVCSRRQTAP